MRIAFIGMGEAGSALVTGWGAERKGPISAYDIKTDRPETADELWRHYEKLGIEGAPTIGEALASAELIFSTVTADQALGACHAEHPADLGQGLETGLLVRGLLRGAGRRGQGQHEDERPNPHRDRPEP